MSFADKITALAVRFGLSVTSWFRSVKRNALVGGVAGSRHLVGLAVDIVLDDAGDLPDFQKCAGELGLQVLDEGDHLHVQEPRKS